MVRKGSPVQSRPEAQMAATDDGVSNDSLNDDNDDTR